jgi:diguanylate cyclase (GGDEF)-like protein
MAASGTGVEVDPLCGALSRGALEERLPADLESARRADRPCALFLLDIDWFKTVNDVYGHGRGDVVLRQVVDRLRDIVPEPETIFRYGGDEFVVVLSNTSPQVAAQVAEGLVAAVSERPFDGTPPLMLSISLGIACCPEDSTDADGLLGIADRRHYVAKRAGRGRAVGADEEVANLAVGFGLTRLLDRDAEVATVMDFLDRLPAARRGTLSVFGPSASGRSRFLVEIARMARLRGFVVFSGEPVPDAMCGAGVLPAAAEQELRQATGLLVMVDGDGPFPEVPAAARNRLCVGYVRAGEWGTLAADRGAGLVGQVPLRPLSRSSLRILLRTQLRGEPAEQLLDWFAITTNGLPGLAERELTRLSNDGVLRHVDGFWTFEDGLAAPESPPQAGRMPAPVTPLIGRAVEVEQLSRTIRSRRLVTLTGTAGIGKTRLSIEVATRCAGDFADGAAFVGLADVSGPNQLVSAIARSIGLAEKDGRPLLEALCDVLASRELLLVLDSFEHLVPAARVVTELLAASGRLKVLVTSRERLKLYGEQVYPVPPLPAPDPSLLPEETAALVAAVAGAPAVALFVQHAQAATFDFVLDEHNARTVAELCRRLDGLPLAIELAAARCDRSSPAELLAELGNRLDALSDDAIDRTDRHRSLRAAIDWSFHQLDPEEQTLLARLGVFLGPFSVKAAEMVMGSSAGRANDLRRLRAHLGVLADRSFLSPETVAGGERRWRMLETIRAYALKHLDGIAARTAARLGHLAWYVSFAETAGPALRGPDQDAWLARLDADYADLQAALEFGLEHGHAGQASAIAASVWRFWRVRGYLSEGRHWLQRCLVRSDLPATLRIQCHLGAGALALYQADTAAAHWHLESARDAALAADDLRNAAIAYNLLGALANVEANYPESLANHEHSLAIGRQLGDPVEIAMAMANLGEVTSLSGQLARARELTEASLPTVREHGGSRPQLIVLINLGNIARREGNTAEAHRCLLEALPLARRVGDRYLLAWVLVSLGLVAVSDGRPEAEALLRGGLLLRRDMGDREGIAVALAAVAGLYASDRPHQAALLLGAAEALRQASGAPVPPADRAAHEALVDKVRSAAPDMFATYRQAGAHTPLDTVISELCIDEQSAEQAVTEALRVLDTSTG